MAGLRRLVVIIAVACLASFEASSTRAAPSPALLERYEIAMLATLAQTYAHLHDVPVAGPQIGALVVWDLHDLGKTPRVLLDRARNFEHESNLSHAETNVLRAAYDDLKRQPGHSYESSIALMKRAKVFSTLEPCPMCASSLMMAQVAETIYCMQDPDLRDQATHELLIHTPSVYGRRYVGRGSDAAVCAAMNAELWGEVAAAQTVAPEARPPYVLAGANGRPFLHLLMYLDAKAEAVFGPGAAAFARFEPRFPAENAAFLNDLRALIQVPTVTERG